MSEKMMENNKVSVIGEIVSGFTFSHEVFGEGFYMVSVAVNRLSEQVDVIPLMISERLLDVDKNYEGCTVEAIGQFRSYNRHEGTKKPSGVVGVRAGDQFSGGIYRLHQDEPDLSGRLYLQGTGIPENSSGKGDRRSSAGGEPSLRKVGLHTLHLLGQKCPIRLRVSGRRQGPGLGTGSEPGVHQEAERDRM